MAGRLGNKIVVAGGTNWRDDMKRWLKEVWVYDPAKNQWAAAPALPHPLAYAAFASDGTRFYLAGGTDGKQASSELYALDEQLQLQRVGELPQTAIYAGGAVHGGRLLLVGGTPDPDDWGKVSADVRAVDVKTGKASALARLTGLTHGIGIPAVATTANHLYVFGGGWLDPADGQVRNVANAFACDFTSNAWRAVAPYPTTVRGLSAVALDDHRIYLAGGYGTDQEGFLAAGYLYETDSNRYVPAPALPFAALTCLVKCGEFVYAIAGEDKQKHRTDACWRIKLSELSPPRARE